MSDSVLAWHFSDGELRFDYAGVKVEAGLVLETQEKPVAEKKGFHASISPLDALSWYAVRPQDEFIISRVRLSAEIVEKRHRLIAQRREHLWVADAKAVLEEIVAMKRHFLETVPQADIDLCNLIWEWIYSNRLNSQDFKKHDKEFAWSLLFFPLSNPLDEKELSKISLRPLANQALELSGRVFRLELGFHTLRSWEKARHDGFDIRAYLLAHKKTYTGMSDLTLEEWAFRNPPDAYKGLVTIPKSPHKLFHEMLMQLAPEGYRE
jgi:hypothetical protein